ncbi:hypothetical protein BDN72DRAFT_860112 [Pluteus cervinus]|uniref:Uncharacterized protein n=1 Tax=Pluteus cervinus TaxID=181527 RepID=A0ACD3AJQ5_9AGAR|nr:hypothetical protein BDN72DRAFT_860112 [Pluteus cervinus]
MMEPWRYLYVHSRWRRGWSGEGREHEAAGVHANVRDRLDGERDDKSSHNVLQPLDGVHLTGFLLESGDVWRSSVVQVVKRSSLLCGTWLSLCFTLADDVDHYGPLYNGFRELGNWHRGYHLGLRGEISCVRAPVEGVEGRASRLSMMLLVDGYRNMLVGWCLYKLGVLRVQRVERLRPASVMFTSSALVLL